MSIDIKDGKMTATELKGQIRKLPSPGVKVHKVSIQSHRMENDHWGILVNMLTSIGSEDVTYKQIHFTEEAWGLKKTQAIYNAHKIILEQVKHDLEIVSKGLPDTMPVGHDEVPDDIIEGEEIKTQDEIILDALKEAKEIREYRAATRNQ